MEKYRSYATGHNYVTPGVIDTIKGDIKRIPEQLWTWIATIGLGALAWSWTRDSAAIMLFSAIGAALSMIYFRIERLHLQRQIDDEYTRAVVREVASENEHNLERLRTEIEDLVRAYRRVNIHSSSDN